MRSFIAIELPRKFKDTLAKIQDRLEVSGADVKWVQPQNIHLTLKFLGEIDEEKIGRVADIIKAVAENNHPYPLALSCVGAFPNITSPRVIWAGVNKGNEETTRIAKELEEKISAIGIPEEVRPFSSHITIGRTRSNLNMAKLVQDLKVMAGNAGLLELSCQVNKITLFKSTLTPKGPVYEALKETILKAI
ncbi:MAG: RNA 2',3'-cyclic phosphodiesterase [Candidatus Omnitrophica bacterium]|nr:RNA 2',3'-cyclic phosphodiesterase [Candidatus Omnitrophota bacterium]